MNVDNTKGDSILVMPTLPVDSPVIILCDEEFRIIFRECDRFIEHRLKADRVEVTSALLTKLNIATGYNRNGFEAISDLVDTIASVHDGDNEADSQYLITVEDVIHNDNLDLSSRHYLKYFKFDISYLAQSAEFNAFGRNLNKEFTNLYITSERNLQIETREYMEHSRCTTCIPLAGVIDLFLGRQTKLDLDT